MRTTLLLLLILQSSLLIFAAGCSPSPDISRPQSAFDTYQYAINSNDYKLIEKTTTKGFRLQMIEQGTDLRNISKYFKESGIKSADCKITFFEQLHPEKATIGCTAIYEYSDGRIEQSYKEEYFIMAKESKDWKVDQYKTREELGK